MAEARLGRVVAGSYRLTRIVGQGGMGIVYEAQHVRLPKLFAVKYLHSDVPREVAPFERFRREAEIASSLGNPHIVDVVDFNHDDDGAPYMVMEFLSGPSLAGHLARCRRIEAGEAIRIADETARALEAVHQKGIVHRDLKPENIFLVTWDDRKDFVKVVDFGVSKLVDGRTVLTRSGTTFGTPKYMSPEQVNGETSEVDGRTDIFALGAILYEMLAGKPAFDAPTVSAVFHRVCNEDPAPLGQERPGLPAELVAVVETALAKDPGQRFPNMEQMRGALKVAASRLEPRPPAARRAVQGAARHPTLPHSVLFVALGALGALAIMALIAGRLGGAGRVPAPSRTAGTTAGPPAAAGRPEAKLAPDSPTQVSSSTGGGVAGRGSHGGPGAETARAPAATGGTTSSAAAASTAAPPNPDRKAEAGRAADAPGSIGIGASTGAARKADAGSSARRRSGRDRRSATPGAPGATATATAASARVSSPSEALGQALRRAEAQVGDCFAIYREAGEARVTAILRPNGRVSLTALSGSEFSRATRQCLEAVVSRITLPAFEGPAVQATHSYLLQ